MTTEPAFVWSKRRRVFHLASCAWAARIRGENRKEGPHAENRRRCLVCHKQEGRAA